MSDELLAMLEPATQRYTQGRGGIPLLTSEDISSALAWGHDKFAALAYHAVFGGSAGRLLAPRILDLMGQRQFSEWHDRENRRIDAMLGIELAKKAGCGLSHARLVLDGAIAARWPMISERYDRIAMTVLAEHRAGGKGRCEVCQGKREVVRENLIIECTECAGRGWHAVNDLTRANACGIDPRGYVRYGWRGVYEWTLRDLGNAVTVGRIQFREALG